MALTLKEVEHIARLARLHLTDEEKERYRQQLSAILEYAARLQTLDTAAILPMTSTLSGSAATEGESALRPDVPRLGLELADLLRNAPDTAEEQFRVPPVLE